MEKDRAENVLLPNTFWRKSVEIIGVFLGTLHIIGLHNLGSAEAESNNQVVDTTSESLIDHSFGDPNSSGHACICSRFVYASPCSYSVRFKPSIATHGVSTRMRRRLTARLMTHTLSLSLSLYIYIYIYMSLSLSYLYTL